MDTRELVRGRKLGGIFETDTKREDSSGDFTLIANRLFYETETSLLKGT